MKNLSPAVQALLDDTVVAPVTLVELWFTTGTVYLSTLSWDVSVFGQTWLGNGWLVGPQPNAQSEEAAGSGGFTVELAGVPAALLSSILNGAQHGQIGKLWLGFLNASGAVEEDPFLQSFGHFDTAAFSDSATDCRLTMTYASEALRVRRSNEFRYNHEDQRTRYPGDMGFQYVEQLASKAINWGKAEKPKRQPRKPRK